MKKKSASFYCIILLMFCQCFLCLPSVFAEEKTDFTKISESCEETKEILKNVQREDSRIRVYLGSYYEKILTKYVTRLNLRLVENNLSQTGLIEGQTKLASNRENFTEDFIRYQQELEELIAMDCKGEPEKFYKKLVEVRTERGKVAKDVVALKEDILQHKKLVLELKTKISPKKGEIPESGSGKSAEEGEM